MEITQYNVASKPFKSNNAFIQSFLYSNLHKLGEKRYQMKYSIGVSLQQYWYWFW